MKKLKKYYEKKHDHLIKTSSWNFLTPLQLSTSHYPNKEKQIYFHHQYYNHNRLQTAHHPPLHNPHLYNNQIQNINELLNFFIKAIHVKLLKPSSVTEQLHLQNISRTLFNRCTPKLSTNLPLNHYRLISSNKLLTLEYKQSQSTLKQLQDICKQELTLLDGARLSFFQCAIFPIRQHLQHQYRQLLVSST